jgi:hypothetical protein
MMRAIIISLLVLGARAFDPMPLHRAETALAMERRDVLIAGLATLPAVVNDMPASAWFFDENIENGNEESQIRTDGRLKSGSLHSSKVSHVQRVLQHSSMTRKQ